MAKTESLFGHSLILFLNFGESQAHVSYTLVSYKKKSVYIWLGKKSQSVFVFLANSRAQWILRTARIIFWLLFVSLQFSTVLICRNQNPTIKKYFLEPFLKKIQKFIILRTFLHTKFTDQVKNIFWQHIWIPDVISHYIF